jgi:MOSC domain-containing protein YiiM
MKRSFDELERAWAAWPPLPRDRGTISMLVVRKPEGRREMPQQIELSVADGVAGDRWANGGRDIEAQVTVMIARVAELVAAPAFGPDEVGDNILVDLELAVDNLPAGARVRVGGAVLEVTAKPHAGCKKFSGRFGQDALRWVNWKPHRARRLRGLHAFVVEPGIVSVGDAIEVVKR